MKIRNAILFAVIALIWGLGWPVMKIGVNDAPPLIFIVHRLVLSAVFLLAFNLASKTKFTLGRDVLKRLFIYSLLNAANSSLTTLGLIHQGSGVASVLQYTQPIMVFILGALILGESFSCLRLVGIALGFSGVTVIFLRYNEASLSWSALSVLVGAFFWALLTVYYKLRLSDLDPKIVNLVGTSLTAPMIYGVSFFSEPTFQSWTPSYLATIIYLGIICSGIAVTLWLLVLKDEEASLVSGSGLAIPVLALIFGWILLGEELSIQTILGSALVLGGIGLVNLRPGKKP